MGVIIFGWLVRWVLFDMLLGKVVMSYGPYYYLTLLYLMALYTILYCKIIMPLRILQTISTTEATMQRLNHTMMKMGIIMPTQPMIYQPVVRCEYRMQTHAIPLSCWRGTVS